MYICFWFSTENVYVLILVEYGKPNMKLNVYLIVRFTEGFSINLCTKNSWQNNILNLLAIYI